VRVEFSQALDPAKSLDTTHVHLLELPDSALVPIDRILTRACTFADRRRGRARQKVDSAAAAAATRPNVRRWCTTLPGAPTFTRRVPLVLRCLQRLPRPSSFAAGAVPSPTPKKSYVDTTLVRQLLASVPFLLIES